MHPVNIQKKVSAYDQEGKQSHTADQPTVLRGRDTEHRQPQHKLSKATSSSTARWLLS